MKKVFASLLALSMLLVGCGSGGGDDTYEVALITDSGTVTDKSFNQSAWEAVQAYQKESGKTAKYYAPQDTDDAGLLATIDQAIENGAKVVVTPGFNFTVALGQAQDKYPDVKFIAVDMTDLKPASNTISYIFAEQESGYLVGYAAVKEGYEKLGFMGGMAGDAVVNYGVGFVQGANDAAKELKKNVEVRYTYTGTYSASPEIKSTASGWYNSGTEIIFSCGGGICTSIFAAAEDANAKAIGVDTDQGDLSATVLTSALKGVTAAVKEALDSYGNDSFKGGETITLNGSGDMVYSADKFSKFTEADYKAIVQKIADQSIELRSHSDLKENDSDPSKDITFSNATVKYE